MPPLEPPRLRLLLDQGFPKPRGFKLDEVDSTVDAVHLSDFDRAMSENSTPDWYVYCRACEAGYRAIVTRDLAQIDQPVEMLVLSRLRLFTVIAWRRRIEDPITEWGQLLAYLPEIKRRFAQGSPPQAILLPDPSLTKNNYHDPLESLGKLASARSMSVDQLRREARIEATEWLELNGEPGRFNKLLGWRERRS